MRITARDDGGNVIKCSGAEFLHLGCYQYVLRAQMLAHFPALVEHDAVDDLRGHGERRVELLERAQGCGDIHRDENVHVRRKCGGDRQVLHQPAVNQPRTVLLDGAVDTRHGHGCANGTHEIAAIEHDRSRGLEVGRNGAERRRQCIEVFDVTHRQRVLPEHEHHALALDESRGEHEFAVLHAGIEIHEITVTLQLAANAEFAGERAVAEHLVPVERNHQRFNLRRAHAAGIKPADDRADARARDEIDRNPVFLEVFQHANMRGTARTAAAKDKSHLCIAGNSRRLTGDGDGEQRQYSQQQDKARRAAHDHPPFASEYRQRIPRLPVHRKKKAGAMAGFFLDCR